MAKRLQHRGGTTSQHSSFTGAVREVTVDTDKNTLVVHDGATAGGHPLATTTNFTSTGIDDNATSTAITIDSSENVGIGTSSPEGKLHIQGDNVGTPSTDADDLVIEKTVDTGLSILSTTTGRIFFGDASDNDVGRIMYVHTDNSMRFNTNASESMRIDSSGNVGIGTTAPTTRLDVDLSGSGETVPIVLSNRDTTAGTGQKTTLGFGLARNSGAFKSQAGTIEVGREQDWTSADTNIDSYMAFSTYLNNAGTEKMRITSSGNVGIGTSSPAPAVGSDTALEIAGSVSPGLVINDTGQAQKYQLYADSTKFKMSYGSTGFFTYDASNGNLGIGTSSPASTLEISKSDRDNGCTLSITNAHTGTDWSSGDVIGTINFRTDDTSTTEPIRGQVVVFDDASGASSAAPNNSAMKFSTALNNTLSERMRINSSGQVLLSHSSPVGSHSEKLGIDCSQANNFGIFISGRAANDGTQTAFRFFDSGTSPGTVGSVTFSTNSTSYNTSSDYRLKENVSYDFDATTRIKQLKPARFNFIKDADTTVDGFLAHEVSSIVPEAITGEKDAVEVWKEGEELPEGVSVGDNKLNGEGNTIPVYQGIDQAKLVPLLVKTIQELEARITALETTTP